MRLGFWIRRQGAVFVSVVDIPAAVVERWQLRKTYINLLELLAAPVLALCCPHLIRNEQVLWFIDNQVALRALIRAAAHPEDINHLSLMAGLLFTRLGTLPWYEWVPSITKTQVTLLVALAGRIAASHLPFSLGCALHWSFNLLGTCCRPLWTLWRQF